MNDNLARIVGNARSGADAITIATGNVASGTSDLSSRTESQAGTLAQTAASMQELSATVQQNAANAMQGNQLVIATADIAAKGSEVILRRRCVPRRLHPQQSVRLPERTSRRWRIGQGPDNRINRLIKQPGGMMHRGSESGRRFRFLVAMLLRQFMLLTLALPPLIRLRYGNAIQPLGGGAPAGPVN
jgi:hypothetical protein